MMSRSADLSNEMSPAEKVESSFIVMKGLNM